MFVDTSWDSADIEELLSKSVPLLKTLTLSTFDQDPHYNRLSPFIRNLDLRHALLSPGPCQISKLTKFILKTPCVSFASDFLLDALERMPLLQFFEAGFCHTNLHDSIPGSRVVILPHLEEIIITVYETTPAPAANKILPTLVLPSARRVMLNLITARSATGRLPIPPLLIKERLPLLGITPKVVVSLGVSFKNLKFLGLDNSELNLCNTWLGSSPLAQYTLSGMRFGGVRELSVFFKSYPVDDVFFVELLRSMNRLESLRVEGNVEKPLGRWIKEDEQAGICPVLASLVVIDGSSDAAKQRVQELKEVRELTGIPIAKMEVRLTDDGL